MANNFESSVASGSLGVRKDVLGGPARIAIVDEASLRQLEQTAPKSDLPNYAAIRPKRSEGTGVQRWEVLFYPTPNDDRTLHYRYSVAPPPISADRKWPYGGKQHAETILQSCLAVAEERETKAQGPATARFMERLAASIQLDMQTSQSTEDGMWPLEQEPSDLSIDLNYLKRLVGRHMGITSHAAAWTHKQSEEVNEAIRSGLRRFYTPAVLPGERYAHEWSFLRPIGSLSVIEGVYTYDLPEEFAFLDGPLTYYPGSSVLYPPIRIVSEQQVRAAHQETSYSARPEMAAIRVKHDQQTGTRWEIMFYPTPNDTYTLALRYRTNPTLLSSGIAKPVGGMPHAQTVIESCLLSADELMGSKSDRYAKYIELLRTSVSHDRVANAPETLGYNRDRSDGVEDRDYRDMQASVVTVNGVAY